MEGYSTILNPTGSGYVVQQTNVDEPNFVATTSSTNGSYSTIPTASVVDPAISADPNVYQIIISNQENLAKRILLIEKSLQDMMMQLFNLTTLIKNIPSSRPQSVLSTSSASCMSEPPSESTAVVFKLIEDEKDLLEFEKSDLRRRKISNENMQSFRELTQRCYETIKSRKSGQADSEYFTSAGKKNAERNILGKNGLDWWTKIRWTNHEVRFCFSYFVHGFFQRCDIQNMRSTNVLNRIWGVCERTDTKQRLSQDHCSPNFRSYWCFTKTNSHSRSAAAWNGAN